MKRVNDIVRPSEIERGDIAAARLPRQARRDVLGALKKRLRAAIFVFRGGMRLIFILAITSSLLVFGNDFAIAPKFQLEEASAQSRALTPEEQELEAKLKDIEQKIQDYDENIQTTRQEGQSLQRDISLLTTKLEKLNLQIQESNLQLSRISNRIRDTQSAIYESQIKMSQQKKLLANSLQTLYETDRISLLELLVSNSSVADFFADVNALYALQNRTRAELDQVQALKQVLETQEDELNNAKNDQAALLAAQTLQKNELASMKKMKDQLLALTKGKEALYQQLQSQAQKTAAEIRAQLYKLRGGGELSFEAAYNYAKFAANATGIRPALLLAVLSKESNLGANVGRCSWRTAMHPTRDQPAYIEITKELGIDPDSMLVSCPISQDGAYGGAMGISQFLPSTWMLYKDRIRQIVGHVPSPWDPQDGFVATALYLADAGATAKTFAAERQAAAKYYAGSRWRYFVYSYGDHVMDIASNYQDEIDILNRTAVGPTS